MSQDDQHTRFYIAQAVLSMLRPLVQDFRSLALRETLASRHIHKSCLSQNIWCMAAVHHSELSSFDSSRRLLELFSCQYLPVFRHLQLGYSCFNLVIDTPIIVRVTLPTSSSCVAIRSENCSSAYPSLDEYTTCQSLFVATPHLCSTLWSWL